MKKIISIVIVILIIALIIYLNKEGILKWQSISMIFAAIAAPFKLILNALTKSEDEIRAKFEAVRAEQRKYQAAYDARSEASTRRIESLEHDIGLIDTKIAQLRKKREMIDAEVEAMSVEEAAEHGRRLFGST